MSQSSNWIVWMDRVLFPNAHGFRQALDVMETCRRIVHTVHESAVSCKFAGKGYEMNDWVSLLAYMKSHKPDPPLIPPCPICEEDIEPIDCIEAKLFGNYPPAWVTLPDGTLAHKACADAEADAAGV